MTRSLLALTLCLLSAATLAVAQQNAAAPPASDSRPAPIPGRVFTPAETIAIVGDQHILAGDVLGEVNMMLAPYVGKVPEDELEEQRQKLLQQYLPGLIENKILYLEFLRKIPPERIPDVEAKLAEEFDAEKLEGALQRAKVNSPQELDAMLRQFGSSLEKQRRAYMEQKLGRAMLGREIDYKPEITHEEMLAYYREHEKEFEVPARARWEQLTVRFANHDTKEAAWQKIAAMGNEVLRGAPLSAVAKRHSEAPSASDGGQHDWITQGSLASEELDAAIFSLPLHRLSQIIDDGKGFHIIRVLERDEARRIDFVDAQEKIRDILKKEKIQKQVEAYIVDLKARTNVWTVFDDQNSAAATADRSGNGGRFIPR